MKHREVDASAESSHANRRLRFELILGSALFGFGLFALPALIYWVGAALLGPYGAGEGLGAFYANFYADLAAGSGRAWSLAAGPVLLVSVVRALFLKRPPSDTETPADIAPRQPPVAPAPESRRVEPKVSLD